MSNLTLMIVGIVGFMVVMYIIFVIKSKRINKALKLIISGQQDTVIIKQTLEQVKNVVNSHFENVIATAQTIVFQKHGYTFIATPISKNEVILSLMPSDEAIEEYADIENKILSSDNRIDNGKIIPIAGSAYQKGNRIIVKTKRFKGIPGIWAHINSFPNHIDAKKFAQSVTDKGFINTKYWIKYDEKV